MSEQYKVNIGPGSDQVPTNGMLGGMAFQSPEAAVLKPPASVTPVGVGELCFQLTNDTTLVVKVKGSDGVVRSATLPLA